MRNVTKAIAVVSLLTPVSGYSLGIGDIRVRSALNQNLNAEISLVGAKGEDPSNIKVSLAPPEKFDEAGVAWSYFLSKIKFQPIVKANGAIVIKVTSREALKEPYLNFLLEVSWPKGNLYREFTVLVDPPAEYQEPAYPLTSNYENYPSQAETYEPRPRQRAVRHAPARPHRSPGGDYGGQVVARRNDTLWKLAERTRGSGVSVEQMMMALYEKNPHAFFQQNVNALSAGKTLKVPDKSAAQQMSRQEALAEFSRHNNAWKNGSAVASTPESQVAKDETPDNQLKLVAPTEAAVGQNEAVAPSSEQTTGTKGNASPTQPTPDGRQASKDSSKAAPVDDAVQNKIDALEKQLAVMQELIALKDKQLAEIQKPAQSTPPTPPTATTEVKQEPLPPPVVPVTPEQPAQAVIPPPVKPAQPVVPTNSVVKQPPTPPKPVVQAPSAEPESDSTFLWLLGVIGTALLSLFGWLWWRKQKLLEESNTESMFGSYSTLRNRDSTGLFPADGNKTDPESSFLTNFKTSDFEAFESFNVDHGDIDPIAEADVYLAYGRYQQAEDLIRQAIKDTPDRDECKLKLLEVFHANSNKEAFENYAAELAATGKKDDTTFWTKVSEMGKSICPDSGLFSSVSTAALFSTGSEALDEHVLFNQSPEQAPIVKPKEEAEHLGVATFEVPDVDAEEPLFESVNQETPTQAHVDTTTEIAKAQTKEPEFDSGSFGDNLADHQDNEALDFDLGPYPGNAQKAEADNTFALDENSFQLDDSDAKDELETFEFDFNLDKTESDKPVKTVAVEPQDSWDAEQTIDFSMADSDIETDALGNDTIDFNFDFDAPLTSPAKTSQNDGFAVSDLTDMDEMETKLDLAKAYIDMGDAESAKDIIGQVLNKGSAEQKKIAQTLLDELG